MAGEHQKRMHATITRTQGTKAVQYKKVMLYVDTEPPAEDGDEPTSGVAQMKRSGKVLAEFLVSEVEHMGGDVTPLHEIQLPGRTGDVVELRSLDGLERWRCTKLPGP